MLEGLRFHHVGIACFSAEQSKAFYELQGYTAAPVVDDPVQNVRICFLEKEGAPRLELLEPLGEQSPVGRILQTEGVTPYHVCYEADDLEHVVQVLRRELKFVRVSRPAPACAIDGRRVVFLFRKDVGLIEIVETK